MRLLARLRGWAKISGKRLKRPVNTPLPHGRGSPLSRDREGAVVLSGYFDSLASWRRAASSLLVTFATSSGSLSIPAGERNSFSDACYCVIASLILPNLK